MGSGSWAVALVAIASIVLVSACGDDGAESGQPGALSAEEVPETEAEREARRQAAARAEAQRLAREKMEAEYPKHGAVTTVELKVYQRPDPETAVVGWLRQGSRVRLSEERTEGRKCYGGYYRIHPTGYVCPREGLEVQDAAIVLEAPTDGGWKDGQAQRARARGAMVLPPPARDEPLPYDYYFVKEATVPSYHRLPSRSEQRAAAAKAQHYHELLEKKPKRAARYLAGELDRGPPGTEVTARYLDRGFFVAVSGTEVRASRRFVRTTQGRYIKQARLEPRTGHDFHGVELSGDRRLPIAWAVRTAQPKRMFIRHDGTTVFRTDPDLPEIERQTLLDTWLGTRRMGERIMHELQTPNGPRYLRAWFAAVAHAVPRPRGVPADHPWVHLDLDQQTAVLYEGDTPVFATLMSSGIADHATPTGVFQIRRKRVTDTMADLGPEAGDNRYRVEDVPWTQYFQGSFALHAAFWHTRFGIPRSHGCINLSPTDAHRMFSGTLPAVPSGWHGLSTEGTAFSGSTVVVTDEPLGIVRAHSERASVVEGASAEVDKPAVTSSTQAQAAAADDTSAPPDPRGIRAAARSIEAWQKRQPTEVRYAIKRGGTARFVANLYEIYHSEMEALNQELDLDKELKAGTEVVIYRHVPGKESRSIGSPSRGRIQGSAPLPPGDGRIIKAKRARTWATRRTIGLLDAILRAWPKLEPQADPILVGTLSQRKGGPLPPHGSHQSGRDVDLGYPQLPAPGQPYNWRDMGAGNLHLRRTWRMLHLLRATGEVEAIYVDRSLQKLLYDHARKHNLISETDLAAWLEYPRAPGQGQPLVQHVPGHLDHLHVRFTCGNQPGCE